MRGPGRATRPTVESLERRLVLSFASGTGAVVTGLVESPDRTSIVATFDGPLVPGTAEDVGNYRVDAAGTGNPAIVTATGAPVPILSARYDAANQQVTLALAGPLAANQFYWVVIDGQPGAGVRDVLTTTNPDGSTTVADQTIDGDADDTPAGDFYGLVGQGRRLTFADHDGDTATLRVSGPGQIQLWRQINGDVAELGVTNAQGGRTVLAGSVRRGRGGDGQVAINSAPGLVNLANRLPRAQFPLAAASTLAPAPVVATAKDLPYSLAIQPVSLPAVPAIQAATAGQSSGLWLVFGGRTNGLHNFDPTGTGSFPPLAQNNAIYVIDPATGQTWSELWTATGLPESTWAPLASATQDFTQRGDRLYTIGGYSATTDAAGNSVFRTYDTLTSISVSGLIAAVMSQGSAVGAVEQIHDPRFAVAGGDLGTIGDRTYLVFGQDFQGGYNGTTGTSNGSQVYSDEIRSFRIVDSGQGALAIADYQAQRDPVNFRRRDGNLVPAVFPDGRQGLVYAGGVFTVPAGSAYRNPVIIAPNGVGQVDGYQQYFSQYSSATVSLFDTRSKSLDSILLGGIGLYNYNFATGTLTQDPEIPFVDDVTSLVRDANGTSREFIMPSQLPGLYGTYANFFPAAGLPTYSNGVVNLRALKGPTTLGYVYGGIVSTVGDTTDPATQTTASAQVFQVTIVPHFS